MGVGSGSLPASLTRLPFVSFTYPGIKKKVLLELATYKTKSKSQNELTVRYILNSGRGKV